MSNIHDDPRLTAYALGELNASDRATVEQQIGESVETLLEIEAIREVASQLRSALRDETLVSVARTPTFGQEKLSPAIGDRTTDHATPTLAAGATRPISPRKSSAAVAVAASCFALASAFAIVAVTERQVVRNEMTVAMSDDSSLQKNLDSFISDADGVMSTLEVEQLARQMSRVPTLNQPIVSVEELAPSNSAAPGETKLSFGVGVSASDGAPALKGIPGSGTRFADGSTPEGFASHGSGSRQAMIAPRSNTPNDRRAYFRADATKSARSEAIDRYYSKHRVPAVSGVRDQLLGANVKSLSDLSESEERDESKLRQDVAAQRGVNKSVTELARKRESKAPVDSLGDSLVEGEVLATKSATNGRPSLVEFSLGQADGVAVGDELSLVRPAKDNNAAEYRGKLRVIAIDDDRAVGLVLARPKNFDVERGDRVIRLGDEPRAERETPSAEDYAAINDNPFASPLEQPLSTFSIDVDMAAYSNMRRFLTQGSWPPADAVRIEELVNYFSYDYAPPVEEGGIRKVEGGTEPQGFHTPNSPFRVHLEVAACPWNAEHRLVRIGLKGKEIALDKRPVTNLVFLIDVSGSMQPENKLPLVKAGIRRLIDQLGENDRVAIVVYAGASGLALDSTNATQKDVILSAIENLQAGGSTNGGEGIQLAYSMARKHFIVKGTNRVILCTDGDFNVGITDQEALTRLIEEEAKSGVFLSVLGFGMGNLKDSTLEKLADKGNGHYAYIDSMREVHKVFVEQMTGTLITIAKDVKIQIEFNPAKVGAYRLIGYENRLLAAQDFHDDTKDAGEIGAGHTVTALYEIIPPDKLPVQPKAPADEKLKYQPSVKSPAQGSGVGGQRSEATQTTARPSALSPQPSANSELLTIKLRYKLPDADQSELLEQPLTDSGHSFAQASFDFRFAASVAAFGMILRHSPHRGNATLNAVAEIAESSLGPDKSGHRAEFLGLIRSAKALKP